MFRFTIRDVLWLRVVVAMGAAWLVDHAAFSDQMAASNARVDEKVQELDNIDAVLRYPKPGENATDTIKDILEKRSLPKAINMSRPGAPE